MASPTDPLLVQPPPPPPDHPSHRPVPPPPPPLPPASTRLPSTHPDRGTGWWGGARARLRAAALVEAGAHAGRSAVRGLAPTAGHAWRSDPASALLALPWTGMLAALAGAYAATFTAFGVAWWALERAHPSCVSGWEGGRPAGAALSAFLLSVETQQTIGYGYRSPRACAGSAALVACQAVAGQLLTASCAALIFARLAAPRRRARSVFVSETACVARRDGALTLTFRVGDASALAGAAGGRRGLPPPPTVTAHLFAWSPGAAAAREGRGGGPSRPAAPPPDDGPPAGPGTPGAASTAEGEAVGWSVDALALEGGGALPPLLLPVTVEHVIDASSPLHGHTPASLARCGAEIVVQVVGTSDRGERWAATRSYLGTELAWGCGFDECRAVTRAAPGEASHAVDLAKFHDVRPLPGLGGEGGSDSSPTPPASPARARAAGSAPLAAAAAAVLAPPTRSALPLRAKPGRSLVLSDALVIGPCPTGGAWLAVRVGDTRCALVRARARFCLRRGRGGGRGGGGRGGAAPSLPPPPPTDLCLVNSRPGLASGPAVVGHALSADSPLGDTPAAFDSAIAPSAILDVTVDGFDLGACRVVRVSRSYVLSTAVAAGFSFAPAVEESGGGKTSAAAPPRPVWSAFHAVIPTAAGAWPAGARPAAVPAGLPGGPGAAGRV